VNFSDVGTATAVARFLCVS